MKTSTVNHIYSSGTMAVRIELDPDGKWDKWASLETRAGSLEICSINSKDGKSAINAVIELRDLLNEVINDNLRDIAINGKPKSKIITLPPAAPSPEPPDFF